MCFSWPQVAAFVVFSNFWHTLYHAFVELIVQTAQDDEARILYRQLKTRQIWQEDQNVSGYFETYSLRYPGEVLERFEEKLGADVRILRALALALGYCRMQR